MSALAGPHIEMIFEGGRVIVCESPRGSDVEVGKKVGDMCQNTVTALWQSMRRVQRCTMTARTHLCDTEHPQGRSTRLLIHRIFDVYLLKD